MYSIEELKSDVEILFDVDAVRKELLSIIRLLCSSLFLGPLEVDKVIEVCLDGNTETSIDISQQRKTAKC